jgi:hypothetical protein
MAMTNGIYSYTDIGGTGKTYVADILNNLNLKNVFVLAYDTNKNIMGAKIHEACSGNYELIYVDRSDMFLTEELFNDFVKMKDTATIILDLKGKPEYVKGKCKVASICFNKRGVAVFETDSI